MNLKKKYKIANKHICSTSIAKNIMKLKQWDSLFFLSYLQVQNNINWIISTDWVPSPIPIEVWSNYKLFEGCINIYQN